MNRNIFIAGVFLLVIGGIGLFVLIGSEGEETEQATAVVEPENIEVATIDDAYRIVVEASYDNQPSSTITIDVTEDNISRTVVSNQDGESEFIVTEKFFYSRQAPDQPWVKLANTSTNQPINYAEAYSLQNENLSKYTNNVTYINQESCGNATCNVYKAQDDSTGAMVSVKIEQGNNRVREISGITQANDGGTITITYDYDVEVTVDVPKNVQELNIPGVGN